MKRNWIGTGLAGVFCLFLVLKCFHIVYYVLGLRTIDIEVNERKDWFVFDCVLLVVSVFAPVVLYTPQPKPSFFIYGTVNSILSFLLKLFALTEQSDHLGYQKSLFNQFLINGYWSILTIPLLTLAFSVLFVASFAYPHSFIWFLCPLKVEEEDEEKTPTRNWIATSVWLGIYSILSLVAFMASSSFGRVAQAFCALSCAFALLCPIIMFTPQEHLFAKVCQTTISSFQLYAFMMFANYALRSILGPIYFAYTIDALLLAAIIILQVPAMQPYIAPLRFEAKVEEKATVGEKEAIVNEASV